MSSNFGKVSREADGFRVRFERILNQDIQTVWEAITKAELFRIWFTDVEWDFRPGGKITFWFRDQTKAESYGEIVKIEPPHLFVFTWEHEMAVWELTEHGKNKCRLVLTYSRLEEKYAVNAPAGVHTLLDRLEAVLAGRKEPYPFGTEMYDPEILELQDRYGEGLLQQFPELEAQRPIVIEKIYNAPVEKVWQALTDKSLMKQWYFDVPEFEPKVGNEFSFLAGTDVTKWLHLCRVTVARPDSMIAYTWKYDGYAGESHVRFELFPEGGKTRLKLTHSGIHNFPVEVDAFAKKNFVEGWTHIVKIALAEFVEGK
jgi:uncharacterized protein YndB with AHSA1/START domain